MEKKAKTFIKTGDFVYFYPDYNFSGNVKYGMLARKAKNGLCEIQMPKSRFYIDERYVFANKQELLTYVKTHTKGYYEQKLF